MLSEAAFQRQITDLADLRGWSWMHMQPAQSRDSWRTPYSGSLGKGWPDLVLVKGERIVFIECKAAGRKPTPEQEQVIGILSNVGLARVYRPEDWDEIVKVLT